MKLTIKKIETRNLRCPDFNIVLDDGINFLQIPNGVGKTTMLKLIKNTLSNNWDQKTVKGLQQKKEIYSNLSSYMASEGSFSLDLEINDEYYGFEVTFDFDEGKTAYITKGPSGEDDAYKPPETIRACLSPEHIDIFCFSADQLKPYFETTDRKVKQTVGTFTGANKLIQIQDILDQEFQNKFAGNRGTRGSTKKYEEKINKISEIIKRLEGRRDEINEDLKILKPKEATLTQKIKDLEIKNKDYTKEKSKLVEAVNELDKKSKILQAEIGEAMKNPLFFSESMKKDFEDFHNTVQVNEIPGYSAKFFDFIQEQDDCICGRPLTKKEQKEILKTKEQYLSHEDHAMAEQIINAIQLAIQDKSDGKKLTDDLRDIETKLTIAKQELADYIKTNSSDLGIEDLLNKENEVQRKIGDLENELSVIENSKYADQRHQESRVQGVMMKHYDKEFCSIDDAKALRNYLRLKEANAGQYKQAYEMMEKFKDAIAESIQEANDEIYDEIKKNMNTKIKQVFGTQQIKVEEISNCIKLQGSDDGGSGAENTVSVTSFALALLERSSFGFPMIIDHPVIGVDTSPRRHLSKFLNNLDVQTICFVITSEVPGFIENGNTKKIHNYLENGNFCTLSRLSKINAVYKEKDLPKKYETTHDGFLSKDKKFFQNFDTEKMEVPK